MLHWEDVEAGSAGPACPLAKPIHVTLTLSLARTLGEGPRRNLDVTAVGSGGSLIDADARQRPPSDGAETFHRGGKISEAARAR